MTSRLFINCFHSTKDVEDEVAIFPDIPQMCKNMADNNNSNVWSDAETEVFLDLIKRT